LLKRQGRLWAAWQGKALLKGGNALAFGGGQPAGKGLLKSKASIVSAL